MNKPKIPNTYIVIAEIVAVVLIISVLTYFAIKYFKKRKDTKDEGEAQQLAKDLVADTDSKYLSKTKSVKDKQIADAKKMNVIAIGDLIYNAKGVFDDDEQAVYSALAMIPNKFALQLFVDYWKGVYKTDLYTFLNSMLNSEEQKKSNDIISKLK